MSPILEAVGMALAATLGGALLHYGLLRASRRLPRWLARRRGAAAPASPGAERVARLVAVLLQLLLWLGVLELWARALPAVAALRSAALALARMSLTSSLFQLGDRSVSVLDLAALPLLLAAAWLGVGALVRGVQRLLGVSSGLADAAAALVRYAGAFLAILIVLQAWGVDVRSLAIVGSVLGVGIGFGLQNIANNFVSGLLIHLGRPIRVGDYVEVAGFAGTVMRVGPRSTEVQTLDRVSILLPNSRFLDQEVVNWSYGDPTARIRLAVGVAYGSDPARVRRALLEASRGVVGVLREPPPDVQLLRFGESSLDFELLVWTRQPRLQNQLRSDLAFRVLDAFRRHGIEIPFPQRDLHLRSPSLDGVLGAWRDPQGAPRTAAPDGRIAAGPAAHAAAPGDEEVDEIAGLARRMQAPDGVPVSDRRHLLRVFPQCFVGGEAVDWLVRNEGLSRPEAVLVGQRLVERGLVRHVLGEHGFRDGNFFYRFAGDAAPEAAP